MSKERGLLKTILAYMAAEYLVMTEFEMITQIEETIEEIQELLTQPEEKREPLSEEALLDVYKTLYQANPKVNVKKSQKRTECFEFARAIEKAHKIG